MTTKIRRQALEVGSYNYEFEIRVNKSEVRSKKSELEVSRKL